MPECRTMSPSCRGIMPRFSSGWLAAWAWKCFNSFCVKNVARQFCVLGISAALLSPSPRLYAANQHLKEVVVVFKTHYDIGYTDLVTNVLTRYRTTFVDNAFKLIDDSQSLPRDRQFIWTIPGWPLQQMLWPGQTSDRREEIQRALKNGRL